MAIAPSSAYDALQNVDALFQGQKGGPLPSTVILDYLYGVAAYKAWQSNRGGDSFNRMEAYRNQNYAQIPPLTPAPPEDAMDEDVTSGPDDVNDPDYISGTDVTSGPDDPNDSDYKPPKPRKRLTPTRRSGLEETMDELNMILMYIHGITPEIAAERRQKEIEREEQAAQEASRSKAMEWRNHLGVH